MAVTIGGVILNPNGETLVVDVTTNGQQPTVYTAAGGSSTHSLPVTISTRTEFHVTAPQVLTFSVKRNGVEIAGTAAATRDFDIRPYTVTEFSPAVDPGPSAENAAQDATRAHLAGTETITGNKTFSGVNVHGAVTFTEAKDITFGTTTGSKIGTATTEKLGFYNATPVVQPAGTVDVLASLVTLGLRAASSNPPLNLGTGAVTAGSAAVSGKVTAGVLSLGTPETVTLVSNVATITKSFVVLDAEGAGTTDQLDTLTMAGVVAGVVVLLTVNATDTITVDDANINLGAATRAIAPGGALLVYYDGTEWTELVFLAASDNV